MQLYKWLKIEQGVTAVIGSGGKTALLHALTGQLPGRVILCTTTHIYPSNVYPTLIAPTKAQLQTALLAHKAVCVGDAAQSGKISQPGLDFDVLESLADYVLVEADGAKQKPLKAHAPHEPVIPKSANQAICVVGALGFGRPILEAAHRPARFAELAGVYPEALATPEMAAKVIKAEGFADRVLVNQTERKALVQIKKMKDILDIPIIAGSIKKNSFHRIK